MPAPAMLEKLFDDEARKVRGCAKSVTCSKLTIAKSSRCVMNDIAVEGGS